MHRKVKLKYDDIREDHARILKAINYWFKGSRRYAGGIACSEKDLEYLDRMKHCCYRPGTMWNYYGLWYPRIKAFSDVKDGAIILCSERKDGKVDW